MAAAYLTSSKLRLFITMLIATTLSTIESYFLGDLASAALLQSDGLYCECWYSLTKLQACTGGVILFFLNGETHLGQNCCRAIHIIQHYCNILRGYCDATADVVPAPPSPPSIMPLAKDDLKP
ncbi:hypothetical protein MKW98_028296 [Papaver atlanticum]|uniref:Prolamin-like domain-containing protein n=1 Tax=Papaver atlanticum TaxID=357466 RepID=A0AAD4SXK3_9MAGN|nr:hypothetical protein MKW98_028296 [Papaver atlanticum]